MSVPSVYINPHATITDAPRPTRKKDALKDDAQLSYSNSTQCFSQMLFEDNDLETFKTSSLRWGLGLVCKLVL